MAKTRSMTRNQNDDDDASSSSSSSRNTSFDKDHVGPWSDVNHDVLFLVMMQLRVVDFIAFRGVCKSWRSFAVSKSSIFLASKPPMKISINPHANNQDCYIYLKEDFEEPMFKTILPHSAGRICFGLTCGYLILFSRETRDFLLVNPITRHQLHFPDFPLRVSALPTKQKGMRVIMGILVFSPSISGWVFVVLSSKLWLSFYIAGKPGWNHVFLTCPIVDVHVFKGKIYTLHSDCSLGELRLNRNSKWKGKWMLLETRSFRKPDLYFLRLVSSNEKLFVISWLSRPKMVMELDFWEMKWVSPEKTIIQEYAIFYSYLTSCVVIKPESWTRQKSYGRFLDTNKKSRQGVYSKGMWYFPDDCLNLNLLDE